MAHRIFICHSSKDKLVADAACAALEARRIPCWIAPRDILAGEEYGASIIDALDHCQIVLLIFSLHANNSPQCRREVERAVSKEKIIVPYRIEDVLPSHAMEFALSNTHWLDALTPPMEQRLNELCDSISRLLQKQADPLWNAPRSHAVPLGGPQPPRSGYLHDWPQPAAAATASIAATDNRSRKTLLWLIPICLLLLLVLGPASLRSLFHHTTAGGSPPAQSLSAPASPSLNPTSQPAQPSPQPATLAPLSGRQPTAPARTLAPSGPAVHAAAVPTAPHAPTISAEQQARLESVETQIDALQSSAAGVNDSLANLQQQMHSQGLSLNSKWVELQSSVNLNLRKAEDALQQKDPDRAQRFAALADSDVQQLKTFLGR